MNFVVTGAAGFLGAAIVRSLVADGRRVGVVIRPGSGLWRLDGAAGGLSFFEGAGLGDPGLESQLQDFRPDVVINAAWSGVGNAARNDPAQIDGNVIPSCDLLRMAIRAGCKVFLGLGSQAEYGPVNARCDECTPTRPTTFYGAAKLASFHLTERIAAAAGIRFAWLRLFSIYGPRDNPWWLIPYLIREFLAGRRPDLTPCEQRWDYLYVDDAVQAVRVVADDPGAAGTFNVGSGAAVPLRAVVEGIRDLVDPTLPIGFGAIPYRPDQVMHLEADTARLNRLGWSPAVRLPDGLARTVAWLRHNPDVDGPASSASTAQRARCLP